MKKRLSAIISLIPQCDSLADVGCDHGYIGAEALASGIAKVVQFCDISEASLNKARKECERRGLFEADFFCVNGLEGIETEVAVIAGMGGLEIIDIVNNADTLPEVLVLQPMKNAGEVRIALMDRYFIEKDFTVAEGRRFYTVMKLVRGRDRLSEREIMFGKTDLAEMGKDFRAFLNKEKLKCEEILSETKNAPEIAEYYKAVTELTEK